MKYAIIQLQGKQFQVSEGDEIIVDRLDQAEGDQFTVNDVLLVVDGDKRKIGQPIVKGAEVKCELISNDKGKKIRVAKYKAKSRYRKVQGHRQFQSVVKILQIN
ncbi:MAG TPA: 50S ribosomal protein L21 [Candidatus Woesebacteria bacterium]|nr:50S ribosomal protein L21 [Candidatus Woesebacteria bacterium]